MRFSQPHVQPTMLTKWRELPGARARDGAPDCTAGEIWLAPADWALHPPWLLHIGATILWECLGHKCEHRDGIDSARAMAVRTLPHLQGKTLSWCISIPRRFQTHPDVAFRSVRRELAQGGVVVCYCLHSHHRSVGSLCMFFIAELRASFADAATILRDHEPQELHRSREIFAAQGPRQS